MEGTLLLNPFVKLIRSDILEKMVVVRNSGQCFLCHTKKIVTHSKGQDGYLLEQINFFKSLVIPEINNKEASPSVTRFPKNSQCCSRCLSSIREVWNLRKQIESIQKDIDKIVGEAKKSYLERKDNKKSPLSLTQVDTTAPATWTFLGIWEGDDDNEEPELETHLHHDILQEDDPMIDVDVEYGMDIGEAEEDDQNHEMVNDSRPRRAAKVKATKLLEEIGIKSEPEDVDDDDDNYNGDEDNFAESDDDDPVRVGFRAAATTILHQNATEPTKYQQRKHGRPKKASATIVKKICKRKYKKFNHRKAKLGRPIPPEMASLRPVPNSEGSYTCSKCGKTFKTWRLVLAHEITVCKVHHDKGKLEKMNFKVVDCDQCDSKFVFEKDFEKHKIKHTRAKPFVCEKCGKGFTQKGTLTHHLKASCDDQVDPEVKRRLKEMRKKNQNRYLAKCTTQCEKCGKKFLNQAGLDEHLKIPHKPSSEIQVVCDICGESFRRLELFYHKKIVHHILPGLSCKVCQHKFSTNRSVQRHMQKVHGEKKKRNCKPRKNVISETDCQTTSESQKKAE